MKMNDATRTRWLSELFCDPVRAADLAFALRISDDLSPSPATAHTALLVMRAALARALEMSESEILTAVELSRLAAQKLELSTNDPN
ncbi:hypothetical protein J3A72_000440 [Stenotrophomonas sp. PvP093]|uniref:hypothetical protein n=1 Tax=unclassified Stenotrophomonas TaxID=196198 RepID=UPI001AE4B45F|nr:hypothetical protein [Stenotrophomonas sp. PvP093]MBP2480148.1 hypothetical protein [Stenotrophomonas sp. PvP093]